jgi:hypothetical protein
MGVRLSAASALDSFPNDPAAQATQAIVPGHEMTGLRTAPPAGGFQTCAHAPSQPPQGGRPPPGDFIPRRPSAHTPLRRPDSARPPARCCA